MAFDFKKEFKEYYQPKNRPEIINVPSVNFLAVRGSGDPNLEGGDYQRAVGLLYAVAFTLKMSYKTSYRIDGFYEYVVPPLEGFWWQDGIDGANYADKSSFNWISVIRLPDFITENDVAWAADTATEKKNLDCSSVKFFTLNEGLCVQMMHTGSYNNEPETVALMDEYIHQNGYENDLNGSRLHHEIYLSDPRKSSPEKMKTVIRHPIRKL
ncbi:MAG: GyrI-like domain-containing protein [Saccharofermentans sp.]|nr:GyrI-like domain-containing protein [Saccharofermentans sp.]